MNRRIVMEAPGYGQARSRFCSRPSLSSAVAFRWPLWHKREPFEGAPYHHGSIQDHYLAQNVTEAPRHRPASRLAIT